MDIKQMHQFLSRLAANNSKEWMDAHKKEYQGKFYSARWGYHQANGHL